MAREPLTQKVAGDEGQAFDQDPTNNRLGAFTGGELTSYQNLDFGGVPNGNAQTKVLKPGSGFRWKSVSFILQLQPGNTTGGTLFGEIRGENASFAFTAGQQSGGSELLFRNSYWEKAAVAHPDTAAGQVLATTGIPATPNNGYEFYFENSADSGDTGSLFWAAIVKEVAT